MQADIDAHKVAFARYMKKRSDRLLATALENARRKSNKRIVTDDEVAFWRMRYEDGHKLAEIAKDSGVAESTVWVHLNKATK